MKKVFGLFGVLVATLVGVGVHALSFTPDTVFLDADTKSDCTALGGSFTEWYDETYCTASPATLTTTEKAKITIIANKILELIEDNGNLYEPVISLLETYKAKFIEQGDMKRLAIANLLIEHITTNVSTIPDACTVRYDGCNTCQVMEDGGLACTKMACLVQQESMCKVYEKTIVVADHTEACVGVGPMDCLLTKEAGEDTWTYFYDSIEGFDYIPGYEWTLLVEETHLDPATVPADGSTISWKLKEVVAIDAEVPDTCAVWYDGCNTCHGTEGSLMACTMMFCEGEPMMPYCMDEGVDNTTAKAYNATRTN